MILAIVQARMSSSRLPGKVLKTMVGKPMLQLQLERIRRSQKIDHIVVATSDQSEDDAIETLCREIEVDCFRGSLNDVLDRFYQAAAPRNPEHVVRLTGDCPVIDFEVIDLVIGFYLEQGLDYGSNCLPPMYPDGLDVEIMKFSVLKAAWKEAKLPSEREHVTPYIRKQTDRFKIAGMKGAKDYSTLRWTVDEPEDFELVRNIFEGLYPKNEAFKLEDILNFVAGNPELTKINNIFERNEGARKSLLEDEQWILKNQ
jgi:spore coat polysaccharide biosynthesis protein SpsF (cytidylyltransferase family)